MENTNTAIQRLENLASYLENRIQMLEQKLQANGGGGNIGPAMLGMVVATPEAAPYADFQLCYQEVDGVKKCFMAYHRGCLLFNGKIPSEVFPDLLPGERVLIGGVPDYWEVYGHIVYDNANVDSVTFDTNETKTPPAQKKVHNFRIASVDGEGYITQHVYGSYIYGDVAATTPGPFEPVFDANQALSTVGPGYWPYGRSFRSAITVQSTAQVASGLIGLTIVHATYNTDPVAYISLITNTDTDPATVLNNTDYTRTVIPLYRIENGAIKYDYRHLLSMPIRES